MAENAKPQDFLDIAASVARRLRNLETGVHPTSSGLNYYDTFGPTAFVVTSTNWTQADPTSRPGWQRRMGIVQTFGFLQGKWHSGASEYKICTLPVTARPLGQVIGMVPLAFSAPYYCNVRVETNGDLYVIRPAGVTNEVTTQIYFTNLSWAVN